MFIFLSVLFENYKFYYFNYNFILRNSERFYNYELYKKKIDIKNSFNINISSVCWWSFDIKNSWYFLGLNGNMLNFKTNFFFFNYLNKFLSPSKFNKNSLLLNFYSLNSFRKNSMCLWKYKFVNVFSSLINWSIFFKKNINKTKMLFLHSYSQPMQNILFKKFKKYEFDSYNDNDLNFNIDISNVSELNYLKSLLLPELFFFENRFGIEELGDLNLEFILFFFINSKSLKSVFNSNKGLFFNLSLINFMLSQFYPYFYNVESCMLEKHFDEDSRFESNFFFDNSFDFFPENINIQTLYSKFLSDYQFSKENYQNYEYYIFINIFLLIYWLFMALQKKKRRLILRFKWKIFSLKKARKMNSNNVKKMYNFLFSNFKNYINSNFIKYKRPFNIINNSIIQKTYSLKFSFSFNNWGVDSKNLYFSLNFLNSSKFVLFLINFYDSIIRDIVVNRKSKDKSYIQINKNNLFLFSKYDQKIILLKIKKLLKYFYTFYDYFNISYFEYFFSFYFYITGLINTTSNLLQNNIINYNINVLPLFSISYADYLLFSNFYKKKVIFFKIIVKKRIKRRYRKEKIDKKNIYYFNTLNSLRKVVLRRLINSKLFKKLFIFNIKKLNNKYLGIYYLNSILFNFDRAILYPKFFISKVNIFKKVSNTTTIYSRSYILYKKNFYYFKDIDSINYYHKYNVKSLDFQLIELTEFSFFERYFYNVKREFTQKNFFSNKFFFWSWHVDYKKLNDYKKLIFFSNLNLKKKSVNFFIKIQKIRFIFNYLLFTLSYNSILSIWLNFNIVQSSGLSYKNFEKISKSLTELRKITSTITSRYARIKNWYNQKKDALKDKIKKINNNIHKFSKKIKDFFKSKRKVKHQLLFFPESHLSLKKFWMRDIRQYRKQNYLKIKFSNEVKKKYNKKINFINELREKTSMRYILNFNFYKNSIGPSGGNFQLEDELKLLKKYKKLIFNSNDIKKAQKLKDKKLAQKEIKSLEKSIIYRNFLINKHLNYTSRKSGWGWVLAYSKYARNLKFKSFKVSQLVFKRFNISLNFFNNIYKKDVKKKIFLEWNQNLTGINFLNRVKQRRIFIYSNKIQFFKNYILLRKRSGVLSKFKLKKVKNLPFNNIKFFLKENTLSSFNLNKFSLFNLLNTCNLERGDDFIEIEDHLYRYLDIFQYFLKTSVEIVTHAVFFFRLETKFVRKSYKLASISRLPYSKFFIFNNYYNTFCKLKLNFFFFNEILNKFKFKFFILNFLFFKYLYFYFFSYNIRLIQSLYLY